MSISNINNFLDAKISRSQLAEYVQEMKAEIESLKGKRNMEIWIAIGAFSICISSIIIATGMASSTAYITGASAGDLIYFAAASPFFVASSICGFNSQIRALNYQSKLDENALKIVLSTCKMRQIAFG